VEVAVSVLNTGDRDGDEVVQLYVQDPAASIAQPVRRLRGPQGASGSGEEQVVRLAVGFEDVGFWTNDRTVSSRGDREFHIHTGDSSRLSLAILLITDQRCTTRQARHTKEEA